MKLNRQKLPKVMNVEAMMTKQFLQLICENVLRCIEDGRAAVPYTAHIIYYLHETTQKTNRSNYLTINTIKNTHF